MLAKAHQSFKDMRSWFLVSRRLQHRLQQCHVLYSPLKILEIDPHSPYRPKRAPPATIFAIKIPGTCCGRDLHFVLPSDRNKTSSWWGSAVPSPLHTGNRWPHSVTRWCSLHIAQQTSFTDQERVAYLRRFQYFVGLELSTPGNNAAAPTDRRVGA